MLEDGLLESPFSLAEARVLYEIAFCERPTAAQLGKQLGVDRGYLSRILRGFERRGLISRTVSASDRRASPLELTTQGRAAFAELDQRSQTMMGNLLAGLPEQEQSRLVAAAAAIEGVLGAEDRAPYLLRPHRAGDIGWVVSRHGALYAQEYGWDSGSKGSSPRSRQNFCASSTPTANVAGSPSWRAKMSVR